MQSPLPYPPQTAIAIASYFAINAVVIYVLVWRIATHVGKRLGEVGLSFVIAPIVCSIMFYIHAYREYTMEDIINIRYDLVLLEPMLTLVLALGGTFSIGSVCYLVYKYNSSF